MRFWYLSHHFYAHTNVFGGARDLNRDLSLIFIYSLCIHMSNTDSGEYAQTRLIRLVSLHIRKGSRAL